MAQVGSLIVTGSSRFLNPIYGTCENSNKLQGYTSDTAKTANTIVRRDGNGYIYASYYNQSSGAETPTSSSYWMYCNSDGWFRKSSLANARTQIVALDAKNPTLAWSTTSTVANICGTDIKVTMPANPNTNTTYTLGTNGTTITLTPSSGSAQSITAPYSTYSNTVNGIYTGNGGVQPPNYFGTNRAGFLMSNLSLNNDTHYKNFMYMDNYSGTDVGGVTALAIDRMEARAWILQSDKNRTAWNNTAELITTANIGSQSVNYATSAGSATSATSATKATQDSDGNAINTTYLKLSGGTLTGKLTLSTSGLEVISATGYTINQYGNFVHKRDTDTDIWQILNSTGSSKFSVNYETGNVNASGSVTATQFNGPATKLTTTTAGGSDTPVYFTGGVPTACNFKIIRGDLPSNSSKIYNMTYGLVLMWRGARSTSQCEMVLIQQWSDDPSVSGRVVLRSLTGAGCVVHTTNESIKISNTGSNYLQILLIGNFSS